MNRIVRLTDCEGREWAKSHESLLEIINRYNNLNIIRRDLKLVFSHLDDAIIIRNRFQIWRREKMKTDHWTGPIDKNVQDEIAMGDAIIMLSIVLYARWFKDTTGKPKLNGYDYFSSAQELLNTHKWLIDTRDQHVAHNEIEIFFENFVDCEIDAAGSVVALHSHWGGTPWVEGEDTFPLEAFRACARTVHNKLDDTQIPAVEKRLLEELRKYNPNVLKDVPEEYRDRIWNFLNTNVPK